MQYIFSPKKMSSKFRVWLIRRCGLSTGKYGNCKLLQNTNKNYLHPPQICCQFFLRAVSHLMPWPLLSFSLFVSSLAFSSRTFSHWFCFDTRRPAIKMTQIALFISEPCITLDCQIYTSQLSARSAWSTSFNQLSVTSPNPPFPSTL